MEILAVRFELSFSSDLLDVDPIGLHVGVQGFMVNVALAAAEIRQTREQRPPVKSSHTPRVEERPLRDLRAVIRGACLGPPLVTQAV